MSDRQRYQEYQEELKAEQGGRTREEIEDLMRAKSEHTFDPDNAPKQGHKWVDRGLVMSCEGAAHPYHQAYKRLPM